MNIGDAFNKISDLSNELNQYYSKCRELVGYTNGSYRIPKTINQNRIMVIGLILDSIITTDMNIKNFEKDGFDIYTDNKFTYNDIKSYAQSNKERYSESDIDMLNICIDLALKSMEILDEQKKIYECINYIYSNRNMLTEEQFNRIQDFYNKFQVICPNN